MVKSSDREMARLQLLAHEYLACPTVQKRKRLEIGMNHYVSHNPAADLKALMKLRLHLYQHTRKWDESLQF